MLYEMLKWCLPVPATRQNLKLLALMSFFGAGHLCCDFLTIFMLFSQVSLLIVVDDHNF